MRRTVAVLVALCCIALIAACDGGTDATPAPPPTASPTPTGEAPSTVATATSTPSATVPPEATPSSPPGPRRTGDPALDAIIEAVEARAASALSELFEWQTQGCTHALGAGGPPKCVDGEAEGTQVRVFPLLTCEPEWHRDIDFAVSRVAHETSGLFAAAQPADADLFEFPFGSGWPAVDTILVFHRAPNSAMHDGVAVNSRDGRIVSLSFGCGAGEPLVGLLEFGTQPAEVIAGPWHEPIETASD